MILFLTIAEAVVYMGSQGGDLLPSISARPIAPISHDHPADNLWV